MKKSRLLPVVMSLALVGTLAACKGSNDSTGGGGGGGSSSSSSSVEPIAKAKNGIASMIGADAQERTEILGALEKYAVDNMITGMPLFENGGYVMYNPRVVKGTETYITGYGFGVLREGDLTGPLTGQDVIKPTYYQTSDASDPATINALDDKGSQVSDLYGYIASSYFGNKMNDAKNGYDWYGVLSTKDRPYIVKDGVASYPSDPEATSDTWRIYVRTGEAGGVKYHTGSSLENRRAFDGTPVQLADYVDAFKILLSGKFGYFRGTELATKASGYSAIKGASAYNTATKNTAGGIDDQAFEQVGVKSGHDETDGDYLQFTLGAPTTRFYAMYALASSLYAPINREFFNLVTNNGENPKNYGGYNSDKTTTPVDNILSTGTYFLEEWEEENHISFKRADDWWERVEDPNLYKIPGVNVNIWTAAEEDANYVFERFLANQVDAAGIPLEYLDEYRNDERATTTTGDSVFKLNVNSCTQDEWNALFGDTGTVARLGDNDYVCKPWMSNDAFIKGMFFSIDRSAYGAKFGRTSSINYFSSNYMMDAEGGVTYNATEEHENALADFWGDTVATGGYSLALSQAAFDQAIEQLLASNTIQDGQTLEIDVWWMYTQHLTTYAPDIEEYIETAFNGASQATAHNLHLDVKNQAVNVWSDVYDKHLQVGKFDLGFGSISGNPLDPLNFMEVLKSDNSSGFTLNWGKNTADLDLEYKGETWSFNTLWGAVDHGIVVKDGVEVAAASITEPEGVINEDGSITVDFSLNTGKNSMEELAATDESAAEIAALDDELYYTALDEICLSFDNINGAGTDFYPDGFVYDNYAVAADPKDSRIVAQGLIFYQEPDDGGYLTLDGETEEKMFYDDCWTDVEISNAVSREYYEEAEDESAEPELVGVDYFSGDYHVTFAASNFTSYCAEFGFVTIIVKAYQNVNGLESNPSIQLTIPLSTAA